MFFICPTLSCSNTIILFISVFSLPVLTPLIATQLYFYTLCILEFHDLSNSKNRLSLMWKGTEESWRLLRYVTGLKLSRLPIQNHVLKYAFLILTSRVDLECCKEV